MFGLRPLVALLLALATFPAHAQEVPLHGAAVRALAVSTDGARLASGGFDQAVIVWPPDLSQPLQVSRWHQAAVQALVALPGGGFASGDAEGRIALWPAGGAIAPERVLLGHQSAIAALAAREGLLLSAAWDGTARLWRLVDGSARLLEGHAGQVTGAAFRSDGIPATVGADGTLRAWPEGAPPLTLAEFGLPQTALAALPDGGLASAGVDGSLRLLAPDGTLTRLEGGHLPLAVVAASADGALLAAAGPSGEVSVWALPEGQLRHSLSSDGQAVWALGFSPDGSRLYTGGADRRLRAFDMRRGTSLDAGRASPAERPAGFDLAGARVFRACGACHSLTAPAAGQTDLKAGPHLAGLFGRRMGSIEGYPYSERLRRGDRVWTPEAVAELFTHGPDVVLPGTRMPVQVLDNPDEMAALLRFLQQATRP